MIKNGTAPRMVQDEKFATYDAHISAKSELAELDLKSLSAQELHNFIRGCDKVPGAWTIIGGQKVTFFGSSLWTDDGDLPSGHHEVLAEKSDKPFIVHSHGMLLPGNDGKYVNYYIDYNINKIL